MTNINLPFRDNMDRIKFVCETCVTRATLKFAWHHSSILLCTCACGERVGSSREAHVYVDDKMLTAFLSSVFTPMTASECRSIYNRRVRDVCQEVAPELDFIARGFSPPLKMDSRDHILIAAAQHGHEEHTPAMLESASLRLMELFQLYRDKEPKKKIAGSASVGDGVRQP